MVCVQHTLFSQSTKYVFAQPLKKKHTHTYTYTRPPNGGGDKAYRFQITVLQSFWKTLVASTHIMEVMLELPAETHAGLHDRCPFLLHSFKQNCNA